LTIGSELWANRAGAQQRHDDQRGPAREPCTGAITRDQETHIADADRQFVVVQQCGGDEPQDDLCDHDEPGGGGRCGEGQVRGDDRDRDRDRLERCGGEYARQCEGHRVDQRGGHRHQDGLAGQRSQHPGQIAVLRGADVADRGEQVREPPHPASP